MDKAQAPKQKLPRALPWLIGYAGVLAGAVGLVYYWRVIFQLGQLPALPATLGVAAVATVVYLGVFLAWRFCKHDICLKAAACVFLAGLLYVFATAPLQVPDEGNHYLRAWSIAHGRLTYNADSTYPDDVAWLFGAFSSKTDGGIALGHAVKYQMGELAPLRIAEYRQGLASGTASAFPVGEPIMFMLVPFLPSALFMFLARLLGFSALGLLYAGRLGNLVLYVLVCYRIFKNCDKYRGVFMAVTMLPLSLSLAASCSYDAVMLAMCFLAVSYFCKAEIQSRDIVALGLALMLASYIKVMNLALVAILLLVPKARWRTKWNPWLATGGIIAATLLFYFGMQALDGSVLAIGWEQAALDNARTPGAAPADQLQHVLRYPFKVASVLVFTLYEASGFLFSMDIFGWQDLTLPLVGGLSVMALCAASALGIQQKDDTKKGGAIGLLLAAALYVGAIMAGMYVLETPLGAPRVNGLQARYFLPAFLLLFMLCSILLGKAVRPRLGGGSAGALRTQNITLAICLGIAIFAAVLLFQNYFVGQWLPVLDGGGHKLVNLFGWVDV